MLGIVLPHVHFEQVSFADEVRGSSALVPHVDRIGHGMCIGLAASGDRDTPTELQAVATATLRAMVRVKTIPVTLA